MVLSLLMPRSPAFFLILHQVDHESSFVPGAPGEDRPSDEPIPGSSEDGPPASPERSGRPGFIPAG